MTEFKTKEKYDLCIIGGGINGAGIARDAAMRGLSVLLIEGNDLASATSSGSTKLIHGGLRYLEYYEFSLVRHALQEREKLLQMAPHIIWPLDFVLPHDENQRPAWLIRLGLFLYDHLAKRVKLPSSKLLRFKNHAFGRPLKDIYTKGFSYADCWVEDARLVVLNAMSARELGADILTRTICTQLCPEKNGEWSVHLKNARNDNISQIKAKKIVNAAGPWVRNLLDASGLSKEKTPDIRLVQGSHIVTSRLYEGEQAYILQQQDRRIVFTIPYENNFTLIGTTDTEINGNPSDAKITDGEIQYLCDAVNKSLKQDIKPEDIVWTYSAVRPLMDDGAENAKAVTRDYKLIHDSHNGAEIMSVFGGKITTYRVLADDVLSELYAKEKLSECTTDKTPLAGGDMPNANKEAYLDTIANEYSWLPKNLLKRYVTAYGTRIQIILDQAQSLDNLGRHFGDHVYEREIDYLIKNEWAETLDDVLWRRSKLGLHVTEETKRNIKNHLSVAKK